MHWRDRPRSPVRWSDTIRKMSELGVTHVIECGPGRVLSGLTKRIVPSLESLVVNDAATLASTLAALHAMNVFRPDCLRGEVALVTGASRGIGQAIADQLARAGATVVGTATSQSGADQISQRLAGIGGQGRGAVLDVRDAAASDALIDAIGKEHGKLSILVNNAGITRDTLAMRMKDDDWSAVIDTNLSAVFRLSRAVLRGMMKARHGRIINITSVVGASGNAGQANYAAAKAGVAGMTRALARELGQPQYHRQLHRSRIYRHRHDARTDRGADAVASGAGSARAAGRCG